MTTASAVSPGVPAWQVLTSLISLTLLYGVLAVVEVGLILRTIRSGAAEAPVDDPLLDPADRPLVHAY
jgi:cytochrome d ubiquinol oxidase subunit I